MSDYDRGRRGIRQDTRAAMDEFADLVYRPMLAEPKSWLKQFGGIVGVSAAALAALYLGSWIVGKMRGWW